MTDHPEAFPIWTLLDSGDTIARFTSRDAAVEAERLHIAAARTWWDRMNEQAPDGGVWQPPRTQIVESRVYYAPPDWMTRKARLVALVDALDAEHGPPDPAEVDRFRRALEPGGLEAGDPVDKDQTGPNVD